MTDQSGLSEPPARAPEVEPGWYKIDRQKINTEAYWDGQHWSKTRRWNGAAWVEDGASMPGESAPGAWATGPFGPAGPPPGPPPYAPPMMSQGPMGQRAMVQSTNGLAVASLVLSILTLFGIGSLLGIIFGVRARRQIRESHGYQSGDGLALAGIIIGIVTLVIAAIGIALWISLLVTIHSAIVTSDTASQCQADVRTVEVAITAYQAEKGAFPTPPAPWSATSYYSNYDPLTSPTTGESFLHVAPSPSNYVIEYDSSGNVWVAPPGQYETTFNPSQGFDTNPSACEAATTG